MEKAREFDTGGLIVAAGAFLCGLYVMWEAQDFTMLGSVFPKFVAILLLVVSLALAAAIVLRRQRPAKPIDGSLARRAGLALALVVWTALIPVLGFAPASVLGFVAVGLVSKYETWTARNWAAFAATAVIGVVVFCFIFTAFLKVPLPGGLLTP